jgi:hypothetical protein
MPAIECYVEEADGLERLGKIIEGISVTCGHCDRCVECPGLDSPSLRKQALALLVQGCTVEPYVRHTIPDD